MVCEDHDSESCRLRERFDGCDRRRCSRTIDCSTRSCHSDTTMDAHGFCTLVVDAGSAAREQFAFRWDS